jgi:CD109 antigen
VILKDSNDYSFIHVEEYGYVTSYSPRLSKGEHHHFIWLGPESETEVYIPIAIHLEQGSVDVSLQLSTQIVKINQDLSIEIIPEGSIVHRHTSVLLDLKNRANVLQFMNIIVDETPIIPYEVYRRFVSGSPTGHVTISGDVIGPIFPDDVPVQLETIFPTGHGRFGKGAEYHLFNLAANTWQLHYLRLTNQLAEKFDLAKEVFKQMNVEHSAVMRRFTAQGGVTNWDRSPPSVWLTAWALRIFRHVSFQDWEDYIYIDPLVSMYNCLELENHPILDI